MDLTSVILSRIDDLRTTLSERIADLTRAIERQNGRVTKLEDTGVTLVDMKALETRLNALEPRMRSLEDDRLKLISLVSLATATMTLWGDRLVRWLFGS